MLPAGSIVGTLYQGCTVIKTSHLPIRYFLALLWAHPILHISTIRVNSYEHRSFPSTSHPFTTVPYVPAHLLPSFPITYFRMASSPKLCKHFLTHYPNNTSYGTSCTSAVSLRGLQPFASCGMWERGGGVEGDLDRFVCDDRGWRWRWPKGRSHSQNTHTEISTFIFALVWSACFATTHGNIRKHCN